MTFEFVQGDELPEGVKLDRLPEDASRPYAWCASAASTCARASASMCAPQGRIGKFELLGTRLGRDDPQLSHQI